MIKVFGLAASAVTALGLAAVLSCGPADAGRPAAGPVAPAATPAPADRVSESGARRIAWRSGIDHVEEILLRDERWEIAGRDRSGNEVAVDIDAHDGAILRHDPAIAN